MTHASAGPAFEARNLVKSYAKGKRVLDGLTLSVPRGRVLGLVGRNGSGKTTLLRCAVGLLRPDAGEVLTLGVNFRDAPPDLKARVAFVSQTDAAPLFASAGEIAGINAMMYPGWDDALFRSLAARFDIPMKTVLGKLSVGQRRMAVVALAVATRPELLLLDEPSAGLDPVACRHLLNTFAETMADLDGTTLVMSTHRIADIERVADSVAVLRDGKIAAHEDLETLRAEVRRLRIVFPGGVPENFALPEALGLSREGHLISALVRTKNAGLADTLRAAGATVFEDPVGFEELFIEHYSGAASPKNG